MTEEKREKLLQVEHLCQYFGPTKAVDDVSLEVYEGETLGLVGESGCGKTTLGRSILRLQEPTGGKVWFDGVEVTSLKPAALRDFRKQAQIVFQDPYSSLNPRIRIGEAIAEPMKAANVVRWFATCWNRWVWKPHITTVILMNSPVANGSVSALHELWR